MRRQLVMVGLVVLLTSVVTVTASQSSAASQVDIVILGGPGAVSATVEARLKTCTMGSVSRVAGSNRYETAATISAASFSSSEGAYIATGLNFPDGLAGGPSAALDRQPVLLVNDAIPAATRTELARLGVSRVTVLGGPVAVPDGVVASLNALVPTTRIAGSDRYSTAAAIAQGAFPSADTVYVATGMNFPDALAGVPAAAGDAAPILLVRQNSIPASTAAQLIRLKPTTIKILGGEAAVSAGVAAGLGNYASNVVRFAGSDRYTTAVAISRHAFPNSASRIYVATGLDYPDVLAGGPAAAVDDGPILLVTPSAIPNATKAEIQRITGTACAPPTLDDTTLGLQVVADGFERPVFFTTHGEHGFVVDQPGRIWGFGRTGDPEVVLDIRDRVASGGERGLLGLAFHPDYGDLFYVNYTRSGDGATVVSEFAISGDPPIADLDSERVILVVSQPAPNHNGGMLAFGPRGDLWIGMGDGGSANDGSGNAQRGDTLLGSLLRIRVGPGLDPYGVVEPHRYAAPEIWAIGLRNPWRFSFDEDLIWIADVGQDAVEEVDRESTDDLGLNLGWPIYEGSECNTGPCGTNSGFAVPAYEYRHDEGCSITGGYVYRGSAIPQLDGHYFFSDWCSGFIRSIGQDGVVHDWTDGTGPVDRVSSFGRDDAGEVYVVSATGTVYRIVDTTG
jgi:putative cell wall-binding protein